MRSRSSTTPHLPSYFLLITSIQLFHHQSYRHTFPVPNEPTKSEVHQIPSHPIIICSVELSHPFNLSCPVCCDIIATTHRTHSLSCFSNTSTRTFALYPISDTYFFISFASICAWPLLFSEQKTVMPVNSLFSK